MSVGERAAHIQERAKEMLDSDQSGVVSKARTFISGDAQFFSAAPNFDQLRKQLDQDSVSQKKDAMKRVIAQICLGKDMSPLFPEVVK
ncbi:hypothetical protein GM524_12475, partial [Streptococcus pneumoniae]|uniref:hypothetical protein n=1 Tax=Streptococcus pneumoniae TaxID=1313 RepID=UPI0012D73FAA